MASKRNKLCLMLVLAVSAGVLPLCPGCRPETRETREETVTAFRYDRNLETGDVVAENDLVRVRIPKTCADSIGGLLEEDEKDSLAVNRKLNRNVSKDEFAMTGHFDLPEHGCNLFKDKVHVTIRLDSKKTSDMVLRIGNHVNVLGMLPTKEGAYKTYRIMEWLKVVAIDGQTGRRSSNTAGRGARSYNNITVEMPRKNPDVSLQWGNLQTYLKEPATIEICPSRFIPRKGTAGMIAVELLPFTKKAAVVSPDDAEAF